MNPETKKGDIYWVNFSPTIGTEIRKIRPALIIFSSTKRVIALPITSNTKQTDLWQIVIKKLVKGKDGKILVDQIRSFDKQRLLRKIGEIAGKDVKKVREMLREMLLLD